MGVWIETDCMFALPANGQSHPAWVCGLKLYLFLRSTQLIVVTPCVGVWIETFDLSSKKLFTASHPAWVCGLKQNILAQMHPTQCHTLRGCVD